MKKPHLKLVTPPAENGSVARGRPPKRRTNAENRPREYLTREETKRLMAAAGDNRYGHRDATLVLVGYRHGLRVAELCDLRWDQIDFSQATLAVRRIKKGSPSTHPIKGDELRALRRLQREQEPASPFVFTSERGAPFATGGVRTLIARLGRASGFQYRVHPHMLRHATGFRLANKGVDTRSLQAFLGHKNIQHTVKYSDLLPNRFRDFWDDD
jgi:type 1 fimbriae regulatory protein FimB/type 1 fimbriae regulatory protein FimE